MSKTKPAFICPESDSEREEDELIGVTEPATCAYAARFKTPSACSGESVRALHEQLQAAASEAGLPYEPEEAVKQLLGL